MKLAAPGVPARARFFYPGFFFLTHLFPFGFLAAQLSSRSERESPTQFRCQCPFWISSIYRCHGVGLAPLFDGRDQGRGFFSFSFHRLPIVGGPLD